MQSPLVAQSAVGASSFRPSDLPALDSEATAKARGRRPTHDLDNTQVALEAPAKDFTTVGRGRR
jgi:hypothetical protein